MELQLTALPLALTLALVVWWLWQSSVRPLRKSIASALLLPKHRPEKERAASRARSLMALLLAFSALLALATWARPALIESRSPPRLQLIVETAGSLASLDRLETNKRALRAWLNQAWQQAPELELLAHQLPEGSQPPRHLTRIELESWLASLQPQEQSGSGFDLAQRLANRGEAVLILTDRPLPLKNARIGVIAALSEGSNLGIISGQVDKDPSTEGQERLRVNLTLRRSASGPRKVNLVSERLRAWNEDWIPDLTLERSLSEEITQLSWTEIGPALALRVTLVTPKGESLADELSADNSLTLSAPADGSSELRFWGPASRELERALSAIPGARLVRAPPRDGVPSVLVSKEAPATITLPLWWIAPPREGEDRSCTARWTEDANLALESMKIRRARRSLPSELGSLEALLINDSGQSLIARRGKQRSIVLVQGFDTDSESSDWSKSLSFPVFATRYFDEAAGSQRWTSRPAGVDLRELPKPWSIFVDGKRQPAESARSPGIYFYGPDSTPLALGFLDPEASQCSAFSHAPKLDLLDLAARDPAPVPRSLTPVLGLLASSALILAAALQPDGSRSRATVALTGLRRIIARSWPGANPT